MQKYFLYLFLLTLAITNYQNTHAQGITSIDILPEQISSQDSVQVLSEVWLEYSPCKLDSVQIFHACGAVAINAYYSSYFDPDSCSNNSEIELGRFPNGFYALSYNMYYQGYTLVDTYQGEFTVSAITGNEHQLIQQEKSIISPNPSDGSFWLNLDNETRYKLIINDMKGSVVYFTYGTGNKDTYIDTGLEKGFYIYRLQYSGQIISGKVFITD